MLRISDQDEEGGVAWRQHVEEGVVSECKKADEMQESSEKETVKLRGGAEEMMRLSFG